MTTKPNLEWFIILRTMLINRRDYFKSIKDKRANKDNHYIKLLNESIVELVVNEFNEEKQIMEQWNQKSAEDLEKMYGTPVDPEHKKIVNDKLDSLNDFLNNRMQKVV